MSEGGRFGLARAEWEGKAMGSKASITKAQIVDVAYERAREHGRDR